MTAACGKALYSRLTHGLVHIWLAVFAVAAIVVPLGVSYEVGIAAGWQFMAVAACMLALIAAVFVGTWRVFGTPAELVARKLWCVRHISWDEVQRVDYPWWAVNPVGRVYRVFLRGQRPIHFFGTSSGVAAINQRLRSRLQGNC